MNFESATEKMHAKGVISLKHVGHSFKSFLILIIIITHNVTRHVNRMFMIPFHFVYANGVMVFWGIYRAKIFRQNRKIKKNENHFLMRKYHNTTKEWFFRGFHNTNNDMMIYP